MYFYFISILINYYPSNYDIIIQTEEIRYRMIPPCTLHLKSFPLPKNGSRSPDAIFEAKGFG